MLIILLILGAIAFFVLRHFINEASRKAQVEELKQLILGNDTGKWGYERIESFCRQNDFTEEEYHNIRKNMYYELAKGNDIHALEMARTYASSENKAAAMQYLTRAAELGDIHSMYILGLTYDCDPTYPGCPDKKKAFYWYEKAANLGHDESIVSVAQAYAYGEGVDMDEEKAFSILKDSADRGYSHCGLHLVRNYYASLASDHYDKKLAKQMCERILERGEKETFAAAAYELGKIYGSCYIFNGTSDELSDRRKAAYCLALAYILDSDLYDTGYLQKTGYRWTDRELKRWSEDAKNLRYNPM